MNEEIHLGPWNEARLDTILDEASRISQSGERGEFISRLFLGAKYGESTLSGGPNTPEVFVINLASVDCLTFIEYVEAMRISGSYSGFRENLKRVRYRGGVVNYRSRNHFFTDWKAFNSEYVIDVTKGVSITHSKDVSKRLNEKDDGTLFLPGISCRLREVTYMQSVYLSEDVMHNLRSGDYIGIYSKQDGLDVSHTGVCVKDGMRVMMRHASSVKKIRKVVDEDLREYLKAKPGIIVLRPRD